MRNHKYPLGTQKLIPHVPLWKEEGKEGAFHKGDPFNRSLNSSDLSCCHSTATVDHCSPYMPKPWIVRKAGTNKTRVKNPLGSISRVGGLFGRYKRDE